MRHTASSSARRALLPTFATLGFLTFTLTGCASVTNGTPANNALTAPVHSPSSSTSRAHTTAPVSATRLKAINLRAADLPAGWAPTAPQDNSNLPDDQPALVACIGGRNTESDMTAEADSANYTSNGATVSSSAEGYRSEADIDADIALMRSPKATTCFRDTLLHELPNFLSPATIVDSLVVRVTAGPAGGPSNVIAMTQFVLRMHAGDQQVVLYDDTTMIAGPRIEATVDFENVGSPIPASLQKRVIKLVADRAAKA